MSAFDEVIDRSRRVHGCLRIDFDSEDRVGWRVRVASWPFVQGTGAGRSLEEASLRAVAQYDRRYAQAQFGTDDDLRNI